MNEKRAIPPLRDDLELEVFPEADDERETLVARVVDRRLRRRIKLDRVALSLYRLIDGHRDLDEIDAALRRQGTVVPPDLLSKVLEFFETNFLLHSPDEPDSATPTREDLPSPGTYTLRPAPTAHPPSREIHLLGETRHACVGCGQCCRGYQFGPLTDEEATRLASETFVEEGGRLNGAAKIVERQIEGRTVKLLATREDGRCIFLSEDKRCIIHKEKGATAKPWMCQAFPLRFVSGPDGRVFGHLQMECFGYHEARKQARPYVERPDEVRRVLGIAGPFPVLASSARLGDRELDFACYEAIERPILDAFKARPNEPGVGLSLARQLLGHFESGGGLETFTPRFAAVPDGEASLTRSVAALVDELASEPATTIGGELIGASPELRRWFADALDVFRREGDPDELIAVDAVDGACDDEECAEILTEFLRNEVYAKTWYRAGDLRFGFAITLMRYFLTRSGARMQARRLGEDRVSPQALTYALSVVNRSLRTTQIEAFVAEHEAELLEIYSGLAAYPGSG